MRSMLKLMVLLSVCAEGGVGRRLSSPLDPSGGDRDRRSLWESGPSLTPRSRPRRSDDAPCGLRSVLLQVRDLGLGYDSDESVLFKYCGGTCPRVRSNHELTLANLLLTGLLPHPNPRQLWHDAPCCRPTHHEDMAFLDNAHRWHRVEKLLAAGCTCVG